MKQILFLTYGALPFPAVKGGAVETLLEHFCIENDQERRFKITIVSTEDNAAKMAAKKLELTRMVYVRPKRNRVKTFSRRGAAKLLSVLTHKKLTPVLFPEIIQAAIAELDRDNYDAVICLNAVEQVLPLRRVYSGALYLYLHNDYLNVNTYHGSVIGLSCTKIITVCDALRKEILKISGLSNSVEIDTVRNAIALKKFADIAPKRHEISQAIRKKFNIPPKSNVLVFSGRITKTKGIHYLISSIQEIADNLDIHLLVIGGIDYSSQKRNRYFKYLEKISEPLKERIHFTGYVQSNQVAEYLYAADIGVVPSDFFETCCLSMLEHQAAGLPTIVSNVGGISEYTNTDCAILIDMDRSFIQQLSKAITELIVNDTRMTEMSNSARQNVLKYSTKNYFKSLSQSIEL